MLNNSAYNLSTGNKWIAVIPFKQVLPNYTVDNVGLNLSNFSLPSMGQEKVEFGIRGRSIPLPTGIKNESKEITFNYILSSDWHQYKFLYAWLTMNADDDNRFTEKMSKSLLDISIYVLSEFKKPLFRIDFIGCFLENLGDIDFNYQSGEEIILHNFTISYALYKFVDL